MLRIKWKTSAKIKPASAYNHQERNKQKHLLFSIIQITLLSANGSRDTHTEIFCLCARSVTCNGKRVLNVLFDCDLNGARGG